MDSADQQLARRILLQRLESLAGFGVAQIGKAPPFQPDWGAPSVPAEQEAPLAPPVISRPAMQRPQAPPPMPVSPAVPSSYPSDPSTSRDSTMARTAKLPTGPAADSLLHVPFPKGLTIAQRTEELTTLAQTVSKCTLCKELACSRNTTVFGVGNVRPKVVFFGEAPGADEDRTGEPFVGRAGQLLTKIIEACGWKREDIYIMNVLKCRPPDNRPPLPDEVKNCRQYFEKQFELLHPEYIVCVGTTPTQALLETNETIGKMRKRFHTYRGIKVVATYHPSYLLRNPEAKKYVWEDMLMLLADMGISPPKRS